MAKRFIAFLALLAIATAITSAPSVTSGTFYSAPSSVVNVASSSDSAFVNASASGVFFSPGTTNDTIYFWVINYTSATTNINIVKRTINATTLTTSNTSADVNISTSILSSSAPSGTAGLGYIGFPTVTGSPANLYFTVLAGTATSSSTPKQLTSNSDSNTNYYVTKSWYQDGNFYIIYVAYNSSSLLDIGVYFQAIVASTGSTLYSSPVSVATVSNSYGTTYATGGANNYSNATSIFVLWKDSSGNTKQATVTVSGGSASSATTLKTDSGNVTYYPAGVISSYNSYGPAVQIQDNTTGTPVYTITVFYNGSTTTATNLSLSTPSGYSSPTIGSFNYVQGFAVVGVYSGTNDHDYVVETFFANATTNISQATIGASYYSLSFFADTNGTLWAGYFSFNSTSSPNFLLQAYIGKLFNQIFTYGNILTSFFALLSLLIAGIFAF